MLKKLIIIIIIFLLIGAFLIYRTSDTSTTTGKFSFIKAFTSWVVKVTGNVVDTVKYAGKKEWMPRE